MVASRMPKFTQFYYVTSYNTLLQLINMAVFRVTTRDADLNAENVVAAITYDILCLAGLVITYVAATSCWGRDHLLSSLLYKLVLWVFTQQDVWLSFLLRVYRGA